MASELKLSVAPRPISYALMLERAANRQVVSSCVLASEPMPVSTVASRTAEMIRRLDALAPLSATDVPPSVPTVLSEKFSFQDLVGALAKYKSLTRPEDDQSAQVGKFLITMLVDIACVRHAADQHRYTEEGDALQQISDVAKGNKSIVGKALWALKRGERDDIGEYSAYLGRSVDECKRLISTVLPHVEKPKPIARAKLVSPRAVESYRIPPSQRSARALPLSKPSVADRSEGISSAQYPDAFRVVTSAGPLNIDKIHSLAQLDGGSTAIELAQYKFARASLRFQCQSFDAADEDIQECLAIVSEPTWSDAAFATRVRLLSSRIAARRGQISTASRILIKEAVQNRGDKDLFRRLSELYWTTEPGRALEFMNLAHRLGAKVRDTDILLQAQCHVLLGDQNKAERYALLGHSMFPSSNDFLLALHNLYVSGGDLAASALCLEQYFSNYNLRSPVSRSGPVNPQTAECAMPYSVDTGPLISVIMTTYNSAETLGYALQSILDQTYRNIEVIISDDVSTDESRTLIREFAERDSRVRYVFNESNAGTYVAKNMAISQSTGEFVTLHDSDDWAHPQRIERQLQMLIDNSNAVCTTSRWFRQDLAGVAQLSRWQPHYTHLNPASTFFRRDVFDTVGYFDSVRVGADSEYLSRIRLHFGKNAVFSDPSPLVLGLHHGNSLTQSGVNAFDDNRYSPVRSAYAAAWSDWQMTTLSEGKILSVPLNVIERHFPVPASMDPFAARRQ